MRSVIVPLFAAGFLSACAYNAPVAVTPNLNVYVTSGSKLPGRYLLWVDGSAFSKDVHATGLSCSAHHYPMQAGEPFRQSVLQTLQNLVDEVQLVEAPVTAAQTASQGAVAMISVRAESLSARFVGVESLFSTTIDANVEVAASIMADTAKGRVLATSAEGDANAQSGSGAACEGAATALGEAAGKAMKELIGTLAERFANSPQVRDAVTAQKKSSKGS